MKMKLFGCKDTTLHISKFLNELNIEIDLITISPEVAKKHDIAGYADLTKHKKLFNSIYLSSSYNLLDKNDVGYFNELKDCDLALCIGWQRLIPSYILKLFSTGIFGMHGSSRNLPFGKGRSPMNWSIIEGRKFFTTNLFKYQNGIDNGPIIDSVTFSINENDTAETLHYKNTISMCSILEKNFNALKANDFISKEQNNKDGGSLYPKRDPSDGIIDWRDDIYNIEKLIRSVTNPFFGAIAYNNKKELKIYRASIFYTDLEEHPFKSSEFGEVLEVFPNQKFLIRCSGGVLIIHEYSNFNLLKGTILSEKKSPFYKFKRNIYGFFDV